MVARGTRSARQSPGLDMLETPFQLEEQSSQCHVLNCLK
jgi:hypothetical protein